MLKPLARKGKIKRADPKGSALTGPSQKQQPTYLELANMPELRSRIFKIQLQPFTFDLALIILPTNQ
jgi:hypothetical protein